MNGQLLSDITENALSKTNQSTIMSAEGGCARLNAAGGRAFGAKNFDEKLLSKFFLKCAEIYKVLHINIQSGAKICNRPSYFILPEECFSRILYQAREDAPMPLPDSRGADTPAVTARRVRKFIRRVDSQNTIKLSPNQENSAVPGVVLV